MRIVVFTCLLLSLSGIVYGQEKANPITFKEIKGDEIKGYIDSLRNKHLLDTGSFSRKDLIHKTDGTKNIKTSSPLYVINGQFYYKLNVITGRQVLEFTNQVFVSEKIKVILELTQKDSQALYGSAGSEGAIMITLKKRVKFNPEIGGLTLQTKTNLDQRLSGEPLIRD